MAQVLVIKIDGYIYESDWYYDDERSNSLTSIKGQVTSAGEIDALTIEINSGGGEMAEGWRIYDYLTSLAIPIKTIVLGRCCSMAVPIFLTGTERLISPNSDFMIHKPQGGKDGDSDELREYAQLLDDQEAKLSKLFTAVTGKTAEEIAAWMKVETWFSAEEAVANGFATGIYQNVLQVTNALKKQKPIFCMAVNGRPDRPTPPAKPVAAPVLNQASTINPEIMSSVSKFVSEIMNAAKNLVAVGDGSKKIVNMDVALEDGTTIQIDMAGDAPAKGDTVKTATGEVAADGDYKTKDGQTITVVGGAITEVKTTESGQPASQDPPISNADNTALTQQVATLQSELAELKGIRNEFRDYKARTTTIVNQLSKALGEKHSLEPETQAPNQKIRNQKVSEGAEGDRETMLEERKATDWKTKRNGTQRPGAK